MNIVHRYEVLRGRSSWLLSPSDVVSAIRAFGRGPKGPDGEDTDDAGQII